jgi:hypothetical protein
MPPDISTDSRNGWSEWSKYVLKELERLNSCYHDLDQKVDKINDKMNMVQIKVAGIGAVASVITTIVILLLTNILGKK